MKQDELDAIRSRCEAATPGPWEMHANLGYCGIMADGDKVPLLNADGCTFADGAFVAHARADVPALLNEVARLNAIIAHARTVVDEVQLIDNTPMEARYVRLELRYALDKDGDA